MHIRYLPSALATASFRRDGHRRYQMSLHDSLIEKEQENLL
ncbi:hypothetical protein RRSWK_00385 [Rhodopirellula sp. SWK7]|nr:hypothetical protein RRSWK_00385 [Rhodopirellula sp. SWK7]